MARQRCVFHKLKNVNENLRDKTRRKAVLEAAGWIYAAQSCAEAEARREQFAAQWGQTEPEAVASLAADFAASIAYLGPVKLTAARRFRTTNALEGGVMRPLRRTLTRAAAYHSATGAQIGLFLTIARLDANRRKRPWVYAAQDIITMLHKARP